MGRFSHAIDCDWYTQPARVAHRSVRGGRSSVSSQRPPQPHSQTQSRVIPGRHDAANPRTTVRLHDLALRDGDTAYFAPRLGDWLLLGILVVIFLGNGLYIWHQMGASSHSGRAIFFGLLLLCVLWAAIVYTFKLSVCVRVGPHGISVVRGPWRTELAWRDVARLTERSQLRDGQRFRWLVALARDGRRMQIRDDMVLDYARFRVEVYERFRMWSDHGGTWGTTGGGPYTAREVVPGQTTWYTVAAITLGLPGVYFWTLLPETNPLGMALVAGAVICGAAGARSAMQRQRYIVDGKAITVRRSFRTIRLPWSEVARVERTSAPFSGAFRVGIASGQVALKLAARTDGRVESFDWTPRIPEYLILRGAGHLARIRLHRLERPDEMLAWVEFYDTVARHSAQSKPRPPEPPSQPLAQIAAPQPPVVTPPDFSVSTGPADPWGAGRGGEMERPDSPVAQPQRPSPPPEQMPSQTLPTAPTLVSGSGDNWLRAEPRPAGERSDVLPASHPATGARSFAEPHSPESGARVRSGSRPLWNRPDSASTPPTVETAIEPALRPAPTQTPNWQSPGPRVPEVQSDVATDPAWAAWESAAEPFTRQPEPPVWSQPAAPAPVVRHPSPEYGPSSDDGGVEDWITDEVEPQAAGDATTSSVESLAESFAAWRDDVNWQPPRLPRFGPSLDGQRDE